MKSKDAIELSLSADKRLSALDNLSINLGASLVDSVTVIQCHISCYLYLLHEFIALDPVCLSVCLSKRGSLLNISPLKL